MEHIKLSSELGFLLARAKFASANPEAAKKRGVWSNMSPKAKALLLGLGGVGLGGAIYMGDRYLEGLDTSSAESSSNKPAPLWYSEHRSNSKPGILGQLNEQHEQLNLYRDQLHDQENAIARTHQAHADIMGKDLPPNTDPILMSEPK